MCKLLFSVFILLSLQSAAASEDKNTVKNPDRRSVEASAPQVPCEGCDEALAHPVPQVKQLNLDLSYILKDSDKGLSATINEQSPKASGFVLKSSGKDFRDLFKFKAGEGTIEIKKKGILYKRVF